MFWYWVDFEFFSDENLKQKKYIFHSDFKHKMKHFKLDLNVLTLDFNQTENRHSLYLTVKFQAGEKAWKL